MRAVRAPHPALVFLVVAAALIATDSMVVARGMPAPGRELVATAVTVDLVIGVPLLGYWLLSRRGGWPWLVVGPLFLAGLFAARLALPSGVTALRVAEVTAPAVELVIIAGGVLKGRSLRRRYRRARTEHDYAFDALVTALRETVPGTGASEVVASEATALALGVGGWRRRFTAPGGVSVFPYLQRSGYAGTLGALLVAAALEAVAVHLLVARWSVTAAWVLTGLTAYAVVWLSGDFNAMRLHPHTITSTMLRLRVGFRLGADIPLGAIAGVRRWSHTMETDVAFVASGDPDVVVTVHDDIEIRRLFGRRTRARVLGVGVDDPDALIAALQPPD